MSESIGFESSESNYNGQVLSDWDVFICLVNSGVFQSAFFSYPFGLEEFGGAAYFVVHLITALIVVRPLILLELAVGLLNRNGFLKV